MPVTYVTYTPHATSKLEELSSADRLKLERLREELLDTSPLNSFFKRHSSKINKMRGIGNHENLFKYRLSQTLRVVFTVNGDGSITIVTIINKNDFASGFERKYRRGL